MAEPAAVAAPPSGHLAVFSSDAFHALNLTAGMTLRRIDHAVDGRLVGSLVGVIAGDTFRSGHSAPFGGPDFTRDAETATNVAATLRHAVETLDAEDVRSIHVRARPDFYSGSETAVQFALLNLGFRVEACELNFHIDLTGLAGPDDYAAGLRSPARRALKHALGEPFALVEADGDEAWERAYRVLAGNRAAKGRRLALELDYVLRARDALAGRVRMTALEHAGRPCAAALTYRVTHGRDLVVYWGDDGHDLARSPMNVLAQRMVQRSLAEGLLSLDIGTSSVAGVPDQGLIQFKRSVGARESLRLDLVRSCP